MRDQWFKRQGNMRPQRTASRLIAQPLPRQTPTRIEQMFELELELEMTLGL
jgi:hypothetical protein